MDNQVIKCDVGLGMNVDPVFASKASPSHQSDSGCSDMGEEARSVSPLIDMEFGSCNEEQVNLFDFESVTEVDEFESELESYLATPLGQEISRNLETPSPKLGKPSSKSEIAAKGSEPLSPELFVDSDSNDDPDYRPSRRVIQSKTVASKPKATVVKLPNSSIFRPTDIHILPSGSRPVSEQNNSKKLPAVKVVKVVKTSAQSKKDIEEELLQAIDDRNKKNAIQAKLNREKKKAYMKNLEDEIEELKNENENLKEICSKTANEKKELQEELEYYRSVLANQSALSSLLRNIGNVENVKLSSSVIRKRDADVDHDYNVPTSKRARLTSRKPAGVCLHVDDGNVSLEFCSKCASMANSSGREKS